MPLLSFWKSNPEAVLSMNIEQLVSSAGDGQLKDNSICSSELRTFFGQVDRSKLATYASHCLTTGFPKSGLVLQDLVNEFGRRLGYEVSNGLYQGTTKAVGNDGLWRLPGKRDLLVEVKTTDAYRIPLDKIASYRDELLSSGKISKINSMLIVVGRHDTGELEAQVRGSRHAWDMRLISVDALIRLVDLMEQMESTETADKVRGLLVPVEYTRLDSLIDVMFNTAKEVVETVDVNLAEPPDKPKSAHETSFTANDIIDKKREQIAASFAKANQVKLIHKSRVLFWDDEHTFRVACAVSKRYAESSAPYWYAYHPHWDEFIKDGKSGFYIIGCTDLDVAFALPYELMDKRRNEFNTSTRPNGQQYCHIKILEPHKGEFLLQMPKSGNHLKLKEFQFTLDHKP